jgi:hypothetical protein
LSRTANLLVLVASLEVAPIDGALATVLAVLRRAIEVAPAAMWRGRWSRRIRDERRSSWCEEMVRGSALFIAVRGAVGVRTVAFMATAIQCMKGQGKDGVGLLSSRRCSSACWRREKQMGSLGRLRRLPRVWRKLFTRAAAIVLSRAIEHV